MYTCMYVYIHICIYNCTYNDVSIHIYLHQKFLHLHQKASNLLRRIFNHHKRALNLHNRDFDLNQKTAPQSTSAAPQVGRAGLTYMPRLGRARMRQLRCDCIPRHASQRVAMGAQGMGEVASARRLEMPAFEAWKQANKIKSPYVSHAMFAIGNSEQRGVVAGMNPLVVYVVREHAHMQLARECSFIHQPVKGHATGI